MTFELKEFKELKQKFDDSVRIILQRDKKESIGQLGEPRKSELLFLSSIVEQLQNHPQTNANTIFYGAMLLIQHDLKANLGWGRDINNSLLFNSLNSTMGIEDKVLSLETSQTSRCFEALNDFLSQLYNEKDASKGFKTDYFLKNIPLDRLEVLLTLSYAQEELAVNIDNKSLEVTGKSHAESANFKLPELVGFKDIQQRLRTWDKLKTALHDLIISECSAQNKPDIKSLNKERAVPLLFLSQLQENLQKCTNATLSDKKEAILTGALFIVRGLIANEYKKNPLTQDKLGSKTHTGLTDITKTTSLASPKEIEALVQATNIYLRHLTIEKKHSSDPSSIREKHPFSDIKGFDLTCYLSQAEEIIKLCRTSALKSCVEKATPAASAGASSSSTGFFSSVVPSLRSNKEASKPSEEAAAAPASGK